VIALMSKVGYAGAGGASQEMTSASLANGVYTESLSYDALARPTETSLTHTSDSALLFDSRRAYDPVGNVANVWTSLPSGTDYQAFCYDEHNRLTWASSATGMLPAACGGASWTAGSLVSAVYTSSYSEDVLNRLTGGPNGSYTYGASSHLDAVTAMGSGYTAAYDAAGNMTGRAATNTTTCAGTPTGAQLSYDNQGRLSGWQNAPSNPTSTTSDLYDGAGNRVAQFVANGATTTTVTSISNIEEVSTTAGAITSTTTSYSAGGRRIAEAANGRFSYLGSDGLGSAEVALDGSGNAQASVLHDPYGNGRYSTGTMPGSYGNPGSGRMRRRGWTTITRGTTMRWPGCSPAPTPGR
jgi:YD repeat-containing protein